MSLMCQYSVTDPIGIWIGMIHGVSHRYTQWNIIESLPVAEWEDGIPRVRDTNLGAWLGTGEGALCVT